MFLDHILKFNNDITAEWDRTSRIVFYRGELELFSLDPSDLSNLYGAYRQMKREILEEEREK